MNKNNHIVVQGRLSFDPEIKELESGKLLAKISLDCESGRGRLYIDCDVWDENLIEIVKTLQKFQEVVVSGELRSNMWKNAKGEKRSKHVIVPISLRLAETGRQEYVDDNEVPF